MLYSPALVTHFSGEKSVEDSIIKFVAISAKIEDNQSNDILNFSCPLEFVSLKFLGGLS